MTKKYVCFRFPDPHLGVCPDPKHFNVNFEDNIVIYVLQNGGGEGGGGNLVKNAISIQNILIKQNNNADPTMPSFFRAET